MRKLEKEESSSLSWWKCGNGEREREHSKMRWRPTVLDNSRAAVCARFDMSRGICCDWACRDEIGRLPRIREVSAGMKRIKLVWEVGDGRTKAGNFMVEGECT